MPVVFSSPASEPPDSPSRAVPLDVLRLIAVARVLRDPALEPHHEALLAAGPERDDRAHLAWVIRARTAKLVEWAEAEEAEGAGGGRAPTG